MLSALARPTLEANTFDDMSMMEVDPDTDHSQRDGDDYFSSTFTLEQLERSFIVSFRQLTGDNNKTETQIHAQGGDEAQVESEDAEAEADADAEADVDEMVNVPGTGSDKHKHKERKSKKAALAKFEEYDVDDPFIDDSEVTAVYESVFDLMLNSATAETDSDTADEAALQVREASTQTTKRRLTTKDFYVYRGPIKVEVIEKEFDEPSRPKKSKKKARTGAKKAKTKKRSSSDNDLSEPVEVDASESGKRKSKADSSATSQLTSGVETPLKKPKSRPKRDEPAADKKKKLSLTERLQQLEQEIEEQEGRKVEDVSLVQDEDRKTGANVRRFYDIDKEVLRLEALDAKERFFSAAAQIKDYDPVKFPTALRGHLERYVLCSLKQTGDKMEQSILEEVAATIPYSAPALQKLLLKKIFPLLAESLAQVRPEIIRRKIGNEIDAILVSDPSRADDQPQDGDSSEQQTGHPSKEPRAPARSQKRRWSEHLRELVFEYLKCASDRALVLRALASNSDPPSRPPPAAFGENALRRLAYKELTLCWPADKWPMQTAELSKECSNWKKRYEKRLLKEHDVDIEQFLVVVERPQIQVVISEMAPAGEPASQPECEREQTTDRPFVVFDDAPECPPTAAEEPPGMAIDSTVDGE